MKTGLLSFTLRTNRILLVIDCKKYEAHECKKEYDHLREGGGAFYCMLEPKRQNGHVKKGVDER